MFRKLFRSKCISRTRLCAVVAAAWILCGSTWVVAASAESQAEVSKIPPILQEIEKLYTDSKTLIADFTQENEIVSFHQKKKSSGSILIKRPDKVRWETLKPQVGLLVSDGKTYWYYTPPFDEGEHGQVLTRKASQVQSKLAQALLAGRFSDNLEMSIQAAGPNRFVLVPKPGTASTVIKATVTIRPEKKWIEQVILEHQGGNRTTVDLTHIRLAEPIRDELFVFVAPPGTERIRE